MGIEKITTKTGRKYGMITDETYVNKKTGANVAGYLDRFSGGKSELHISPKFAQTSRKAQKSNWQKSTMLVLAVTLHNIPEGMAVGVAFAGMMQKASPLHWQAPWHYHWYCNTEFPGRSSLSLFL